MWQQALISILVKAGTTFLLNLGEEVLKALKERNDNNICHEDVKRIQLVKNERLGQKVDRDANY